MNIYLQEELLCKKYKIKDRRKKKPEDLENQTLMEQELSKIPRPKFVTFNANNNLGYYKRRTKINHCLKIFF